MITLERVLNEHANHALPTQYRLGDPHGRTTLCFQNFYQQLFPDRETPVDLYVLCFDGKGHQLEGVRLAVSSGEAVQFDTIASAAHGSGLIAAMAVPAFDLAQYNAGRLKLKHELGTGFYVIWEDAAGHVDTMHEWMQVRRAPAAHSRYYMVFDSARGTIERSGLVLTNPAYGASLETRAALSLYTREGMRLGRCELPAVPPMGSRMILLDEFFPAAPQWLAQHGALGAEIDGTNLVEPLTVEFHSSGDLHLHHIN